MSAGKTTTGRRGCSSAEIRIPGKPILPPLQPNWTNSLTHVFIYIEKATPEEETHTHSWNRSLAINSSELRPVLCERALGIAFALKCLSIIANDFQDNVNDSNAGVNESIFFSFVCRMTQMNAQKCYWMLIKMQKSLLNLIYAQMFAFSR